MRPEDLSEQLRRGTGRFLSRRRQVTGLSLAAAGSMALISLYQLGLIRHLPDPPLPGFDSDRVDASPQAYSKLDMPDGPIGLGSYAATLGLAAMGGRDRQTPDPHILRPQDGLRRPAAGKLSIDQVRQHRALCVWCLVAAGATFASVPLTIPEARAALRELRGG